MAQKISLSLFALLFIVHQAERTVWETMQTKAEEKRKGYCCVVWSERPLTRDMLTSLEQRSTSGGDVDETGEACIEVMYCSFLSCFFFC